MPDASTTRSVPEAHRERQRRRFLAAAGRERHALEPLAEDASFRRYFRLKHGAERCVLMDAPPPMEDVRAFARIAAHLRAMGLRAPRVFARDEVAGFLILEDLGDATFTRLLARGADESALYGLAVDTLVRLHRHPRARAIELPRYDAGALLAEALLLPQWLYPLLHGRGPEAGERDRYARIWEEVFAALPQPATTLVLKDFHVDNLMLIEEDGARQCALLDFQDGLIGPAAYDLMSLLQDARRDVDPAFERRWLERYLREFPLLDRDNFLLWYRVLAAQRHAKVLGVFSRLCLRDGKRRYLVHLPRVHALLRRALDPTVLGPLGQWMDRHFPASSFARSIPRGE